MDNTYVIPQIQIVRARPTPSAAIIAPLYFLLAGTAGMYHPQAVAKLADFSPTPIIRVTGRESRKSRNVAQKISKARAALGLNMTEVAELFDVSRTAVYDWIKGANPKTEIIYQIELLASYADSIGQSDLGGPSPAGRRILAHVRSGQSLDHALSVQNVLTRNPKNISARRLGFGSLADNDSSFSELVTPIILERT